MYMHAYIFGYLSRYVHLYICARTCIHAKRYRYAPVPRACVSIHAYIHSYTYLCMCARLFLHAYRYMYRNRYTYMYMHMSTCTSVCMCAKVCNEHARISGPTCAYSYIHLYWLWLWHPGHPITLLGGLRWFCSRRYCRSKCMEPADVTWQQPLPAFTTPRCGFST